MEKENHQTQLLPDELTQGVMKIIEENNRGMTSYFQ